MSSRPIAFVAATSERGGDYRAAKGPRQSLAFNSGGFGDFCDPAAGFGNSAEHDQKNLRFVRFIESRLEILRGEIGIARS